MFILRALLKMFQALCRSEGTLPNGIDSHKWESKTEILRSLSIAGMNR
jgi:hypothetical protein